MYNLKEMLFQNADVQFHNDICLIEYSFFLPRERKILRGIRYVFFFLFST